jgi:hypothetical protein
MSSWGDIAPERPTEKYGQEALRTLSDKPLEDDADDRLDFVAYADALTELLDHPATDTPLTIAISARWGAGKTSLAKMVEGRLKRRPIQRGDPPHITCWFNAWMHDDAPHLGAAFAAEVAKTTDRYRPMWRRLISPLPSAMLSPEERWRRRLGLAAASFIAAVVITLAPGPGRVLREAFAPKVEVIDRLQGLFGSARVAGAILVLVAFALSRRLFAIAQAAARFVDDPKSEAAKGSMQDVSAQLGQLIDQATHVRRQWLVLPRDPRRLIIFVDDLERCRPPRAVDICEVSSQLLGHPNVVTVLIADMATIAASAEIKYAQLEQVRSEDTGAPHLPGSYGRLYLQKIVQIQFNLPASPVERMPELLNETPGRSSAEATESPDPRKLTHRQARFMRRSILSMPITSLALFTLAYIRSHPQGPESITVRWGIEFFSLATIWTIALVISADLRGFRAKQAQILIDREIRQAMLAGASTTDEILSELHRSGPKQLFGSRRKRRRYEGLALQRIQRMLADESARRQQAESEIKQYLPALPRSAKRLFNHLRVLLLIAEGKNMFGGKPDLQAKHLGKWAVLLERWPELSSSLTDDPGRLTELEEANSVEELSKRLGPTIAASVTSQDLLAFLKSPTKLAQVADRLVYFKPANFEQGGNG